MKIGKMQEIANEMGTYKVQILVLQEIRWKNQRKIDRETCTLYYSGENKQGRKGTTFMVDEKMGGKII